MTGYGKLNLLGMALLPVAATLAAVIVSFSQKDWANGATLGTVFIMNAIPAIWGGIAAGLLLRGARKAGGRGAGIALWPVLIPAVVGGAWYLWRAVSPAEVAPQAEYITGPQYLLMGVILLNVVAWIGCRVARAR
jgi:hypothetical protein